MRFSFKLGLAEQPGEIKGREQLQVSFHRRFFLHGKNIKIFIHVQLSFHGWPTESLTALRNSRLTRRAPTATAPQCEGGNATSARHPSGETSWHSTFCNSSWGFHEGCRTDCHLAPSGLLSHCMGYHCGRHCY